MRLHCRRNLALARAFISGVELESDDKVWAAWPRRKPTCAEAQGGARLKSGHGPGGLARLGDRHHRPKDIFR